MANKDYGHFTATPLAGAAGALIDGIDLSGDLPEDVIAALRRALMDHLVVFFRDQAFSDEGLMAFGRRFGDLLIHPNLVPQGPHPEIVQVRKEPQDTKVIGAEWHADTTCLEAPPMAAVLYAVETPPTGGDTIFANQYLAYDGLSDGLKNTLGGMRAIHNDTRVAGPGKGLSRARSNAVREDADWRPTESLHPVVRTLPETGRKTLFVNIAYTRRFEGMTEEESAPLLDYLFRHAAKPEFTCRFSWEDGSVAFWDNRCLTHLAVNDYHGQRREMRRVQIIGERPQ